MISRFIRTEGFFVSLIILLVAASLSPVLFFGRMFFNEEQIGFYYPQSYFFAKSLQDNTSLLWNNGYYAGISVPFGQFVSAYFPVNRLLFSFFPFIVAHHLSIFIGVLSGSLFAYFFGRSSGFSKSSSFVLFSSYLLATTFGWLAIGTLAAWSFFMIPALFLAILQASKGSRPLLWTILGGVFIGVGFLAGFPQIAFYGYTIAGAFAFYLFFSGEKEGDWQARASILWAFGGMTILGVFLSLPQTLPSIFLVGSSIRTSGFALQPQNINSPGVIQFIAFLLPEYVKTPFIGGGGTHGFYVGALAFLAALIGFLILRTKVQTFFLLLYAGILWVAFHLPPFSWLNDYLFPFSHFSSSFRWTVAGAWPLAFLAASGYQNLIVEGVSSEKEIRALRWIFRGIIVFLLMVVIANISLFVFGKMPGLQSSFLEWYLRGKNISFPKEHYVNVLRLYIEEARSSLSISDWRTTILLLLLPASFFLIKYFRERRIGLANFKRLSLLLISVNVLLVPLALLGRAFSPASILAEKPRIVQAIEKRENNFEDFRIFGFLIGDSIFRDITSKRKLTPAENAKILQEVLALNTNVFYSIDRFDGADYYRTLRHNQIIDTVIFSRGPYVFDREALSSFAGTLDKEYNIGVLKAASFEERIRDLGKRLPLLSAFNVKYIYSPAVLSNKDLGEIPLPPAGLGEIPIHLYENKNVLPRVYFPEKVKFFVGNEKELLGMMVDNQDFQKTAFVECDKCEASRGEVNEFRILRYEDGLLEAEVRVGEYGPSPADLAFVVEAASAKGAAASSHEGRWLVFNESFSPGWEARIDGGEAPIYRANYIVQGIYVPFGSHQIEFRHIGVISKKWKEFLHIFN